MPPWRLSFKAVIAATTLAVVGTLGFTHQPVDTGPPDVVVNNAPPETPQPQVNEVSVPETSEAPEPQSEPSQESAPQETDDSEVIAALPETTTASFGMVGVTWKGASAPEGLQIEIRTRAASKWEDWQALDVGESLEEGGRGGTEPLWVGEADGVAVNVTSTTGEQPEDLKIVTVDPGEESPLPSESSVEPALFETDTVTSSSAVTAAAAPSKPAIISRSAWGASSGSYCSSPTDGGTTQGAVIHHTAGSNSYTKAGAASVVRAAQSYHINGQKWCDIGYNFLVDKYGQIFEGRKGGVDKTVRGAHAGNFDVNLKTMGVSLMGNYDTAVPSSAIKTSVVNLVAWRFGASNLKAKGTYSVGGITLNRIAGHRNVKSTACPGKYAYAWLSASGGLRDRVEDRLSAPSQPSTVTGLKASSISSSAATVSWSRITGATKYRIYYSKSSSMPSACEPNCKVITPSDQAKPSYRLTGLTPGTTYYVKVSALNSSGKTLTGWQSTPLTVKVRPNPVSGISASSVSSTAVTMGWNPISGAAKYRIYYSKSSSMPSACEPNCQVVTPSNLSAPSHRLTGLSPGAKYYIKISALDSSGRVITGWQDSPVTVQLAPEAEPVQVEGLAASGQSPSAVTLSWGTTQDAVKYRVYYSKSASMPAKCEPNCHIVTPSDLSKPSFRLTGLTPGATYYVKVSALNSAGKTITGWQEAPLTVKLPAEPIPDQIAGLAAAEVSSSAGTVSWDRVSTAVKYRVYYSKSSSMPAKCEPNCRVVTPADLDDPSYRLTGLSPGTTYYVKVSALNSAGKTITDWQTTPLKMQLAPASIPDQVGGLAAADTTSSTSTVSWDRVSTAVKYRVYYSKSSSMPAKCEPNCRVVTPSDLNDPSYRLTGLSPGTTYYVKVSALNSAGKTITDWQTTPLSFKTAGTSSVSEAFTVPSSRSVPLAGHGYGHGIGMSQYGAQGAARQGQTYDDILAKYYPGTALSTKTGNIRVNLTKDSTDSVIVVGRSGLKFRNVATNSVFSLPTSINSKTVIRWRVMPRSGAPTQSSLQYRTSSSWMTYGSNNFTGAGQFESTSPMTLVMPDDSGVKYRGALRSALPKTSATNRDTINVLSIEDYTRGVVSAEMPSSWHSEALKAQSVAARTYGVRSIKSSGHFDICDTTSCQVYGGVARETASTDAAIRAVSGKILTYGGTPAFTQFSSSSGGYSAQGSQPYLKAVSDPWDNWSGNGNHAWTLNVSASTIEKAHTSIGTLKSLRVTKRTGNGDWGGRVSSMTLTGSKGTKTITGDDARWTFGLKSNWFRFA